MIIRLFLSAISVYKTAIKSMVLRQMLQLGEIAHLITAIFVRWGIYNSPVPYALSAIFTHPGLNPYPFYSVGEQSFHVCMCI